jgi:transposase
MTNVHEFDSGVEHFTYLLMAPYSISPDMKARIPTLFYDQSFTVKMICDIMGVKKSFIYQTLQYYNTYGVAAFSILPILTLDGIITHDVIPGSVTSERFLRFLRELVIPLTNPYPGPRSVLVLDNCNIHHSEKVRALVEDKAMCKLIFLPPYSPDLNPIEQAFFSIKSHLRRNWQDFSLSVIDNACHNVTADMAWGFF